MWLAGLYTYSAVSTAIEHCLAGRKAKSRYFEEPLLKQANKQKIHENMTDNEKRIATEQFFMSLKIMQSNFELNNGKAKSN